jgi:hypothetical protein
MVLHLSTATSTVSAANTTSFPKLNLSSSYITPDLYVLPRFGVIPGHEHKACMNTLSYSAHSNSVDHLTIYTVIPFDNVLFHNSPNPAPSQHSHRLIHARITKLNTHSVELATPVLGIEGDQPVQKIKFDYAVYALGSRLPGPIDLWDDSQSHNLESIEKKGTKVEAIKWLKCSQERIARAQNILVVGGGALGIRMYTAISVRACYLTIHNIFRVCFGYRRSLPRHTCDAPPLSQSLASQVRSCPWS